ncbi:MAG: nuclear transport factor 2 family protein [Acidimicrobiia bacterium]
MKASDREQIVHTLFERLSARDFRGVANLLDDDVEFDLAFAPDFLEMPVRGPAAMEALLTNVIGAMFEPFRIEVTATYPGEDTETLVAEYRSEAVVKHNERPYLNRYVGIFRFAGDKIRFWREYHNPEAATAALS